MKAPSWLRASPDDVDELPPQVPPVAILPEPQVDEETKAVADAARIYAILKRDQQAAKQREDQLQTELAEAVLARAGDQKKIELLELDVAQQANDIQTLQSQIEEYRRFMDVWRDMHDKTRSVFDRFGIKGTPKKERKPRPKKEKAKKHDRQEADQSTEAAS